MPLHPGQRGPAAAASQPNHLTSSTQESSTFVRCRAAPVRRVGELDGSLRLFRPESQNDPPRCRARRIADPRRGKTRLQDRPAVKSKALAAPSPQSISASLALSRPQSYTFSGTTNGSR